MRWRFGERRANPYSCCFCCHVRLGTVLIGIFSLLIDLLIISLSFVLLVHPELQQRRSYNSALAYGTAAAQVTSHHVDNVTTGSVNVTVWTSLNNLNCDDRFVGLIYKAGSAMIAVGLLYGTIKGYPKYLLPFFCLQVFDFCVLALSVIGYFSYEPSVKLWLSDQKWLPLRSHLLALDSGWLLLLAALFAVSLLWLQAYCISVVWSCYKYLSQSSRGFSSGDHILNFDAEMMQFERTGPSAYTTATSHNANVMVLPPKYEDVLQMPEPLAACNMLDPPPPPYTTEAAKLDSQ